MIQTQEKMIDGSNYSVTQLPARRALKMKARLLKLFGPALAQFFIACAEKSPEIEKKDDLIKAFEILSMSIDENQFESIITELLSSVRKNGVELTGPVIDLEFAGDMAAIYQMVWFVIEVNYSNFFSMLGIGSQYLTEQITPTQSTKRTFTRA